MITGAQEKNQDHFGLILNEPAGKIAQVVIQHAVNLIVQVSRHLELVRCASTRSLFKAWSDDSNPDSVLDIVSTVLLDHLSDIRHSPLSRSSRRSTTPTMRMEIHGSNNRCLNTWSSGWLDSALMRLVRSFND